MKSMDREEALSLLQKGQTEEWDRKRASGEEIPSLPKVDLTRAQLRTANLEKIHLLGSNLNGADLSGANLSQAYMFWVDLKEANLSGANLSGANLSGANLSGANLRRANLTGADLSEAKLIKTDLSRATLSGADISKAEFRAAKLVGTDFQSTINGWTIFCDVDLAEAEGLARTEHRGPSYISTETLATSRGQIPDSFLHGSGLAPWERLSARLYDPSLTPHEITELQYRIFDERTHGPMFVGGIFISYSWKDVTFINKPHSRLEETNARVWLDRHDAVAGPLQKQVYGAIRLNDIVILVLSKDSIRSDWVENELEMARRKEKEEERDVLCPIALDDSWKSKMEIDEPNRALWLTLRQKLVLDFSKWKTKVFKPTFEKLVRGLKMYYPPAGRTSPQPPAGEI